MAFILDRSPIPGVFIEEEFTIRIECSRILSQKRAKK
jgi:hypothetical protein